MSSIPIDINRIESRMTWLVEELGPRTHMSKSGQFAALGVKDYLEESGWDVQTIQLPGNIVTCRGTGSKVFLAHTDTVQQSSGAVDNASGVVALLELANVSTAQDICLAFPVAEELGLLGSKQMASLIGKWHPNPKDIDLVVSLDLVGHGSLWVTGLSTKWNEDQLHWLFGNAEIQSEYGYQVVSRVLPSRERSDHAPFANEGYLSLQLLGRDENGIFPHYHQPEDKDIQVQKIVDVVEVLESLAIADSPPKESSLPALTFHQVVLPPFVLYGVALFAVALSFREIKYWKETVISLWKGIVIWIVAWFSMIPFVQLGLFSSSIPEQTAASIYPIDPTGWWNGAFFAGYLPMIVGIILREKLKPTGSGTLLATIIGLCFAYIDIVFAFPFFVAAILGTFESFLLLVASLYWLQGSILRELSFHAILPPWLWGILVFTLLPLFVDRLDRERLSLFTEKD